MTVGQVQHGPDVTHPGADGDDDRVALDVALVGLDGGHRAGAVVAEPEHLRSGEDADAGGLGLGGEPVDRGDVVGVAAPLLVKDAGDVLRLPVREEILHVRPAVGLALDEGRRVADRALLLVYLRDVAVHDLGTELHVADAVIREGVRVRFPHRHRVLHQLAHGGLEVVVAHDAARDARRPGADVGLVEDDDAVAPARSTALQLLGEFPGRRQSVDPRADHDISARLR